MGRGLNNHKGEDSKVSDSPYLLEDIFSVSKIDPDGKRFDLVSRIVFESDTDSGLDMLLDVNVSIYPVETSEKFSIVLAKSLAIPGQEAGSFEEEDAWRANVPTLADRYEYVVYGRVFKFEEVSGTRMAMYVSFGGLLMRLEAEPRRFAAIPVASNLYLLARKVN